MILTFIKELVQLKVSCIGFNKNAAMTIGKAVANHKLAEVSVALLTFGFRVTLRI